MSDEAREKRARDYVAKYHPTADDRQCYGCDRIPTADELVAGLLAGEMFVQSFTGRVFCSEACFEQYKESEGLA